MRNTIATIDLDAIRYNAKALKACARDARLLAVVKADAYGHGAVQVAKAALEGGAEWLGTALYEEAADLRDGGITAPILVFGAISPEDAAACVAKDISAAAFSPEHVLAVQQAAKACGKQGRIHLKIDSGFHRIGLNPQRLLEVLRVLESCPDVCVEGMYTHFAEADAVNDVFVDQQYQAFSVMEEMVRAAGHDPIVHVCNSAATVRRPELARDMVRGGILLYGCLPSTDVSYVETRPAMAWHTRILQLQLVPEGETVGYGRTFTAPRDMLVATLPVGYADGYRRVMQQDAVVLIHGKRCPVVGRICMDQMMVDVSALQEPKVGDSVVLMGTQGEQTITADEMAAWAGTIGYEILTGVSKRVPRRYLHE